MTSTNSPPDAGERGLDLSLRSAVCSTIVRDALEGILVLDPDMGVLELNPAAERLFGLTRAEAQRLSFADLFRAERVSDPIELVGATCECVAERSDGRTFPCEVRLSRLDLNDQIFFAASVRDVSEVHAERTARGEVEALLRSVFDDQTEVIFRFDAEMRCIFCNAAACRLYGVPETSLIGRSLFDDVEPAIRDRLARELAALTPQNAVGRATDPKRLPNGETRWFDWTNRALFDDAGALVGYQSVGRDVTERQITERALAASEARFAAFMRNAPVGMYIKDGAGRFVVVNPEIEKVFGRPAGEIIGRSAGELLPPGLTARIDESDAGVRATGRPSAIEQHAPGSDKYAWKLVVRFPIEGVDGAPQHVGGFDIDISAMKAAESELSRARDALHQSEKLNVLGTFAAGVAHDLNNPLAILAGQAELLAEDVADGPLAERADMILRAADRCSRIVHGILAAVRRDPPARTPTDLNAVVRAALDLVAPALERSEVRVLARLDPNKPVVAGDADQLHQVVLNLLANAEQALRDWPGNRQITVVTSRGKDGAPAVLDVRDTGPGVPEASRASIFDALFTTKDPKAGTGLGLSLCRRIVEAHDGQIALVRDATGARFRVTLPAVSR